jgi:hypothetical protein
MMKFPAAAALLLLAATAHADQNLLPNGDFSSAQQLTGWLPFPGSGPIAFSSSMNASGAASGSIVLSSSSPDGGTGAGSTCMQVAPGATYRYGGKLSPANPSGVTSAARFSCYYHKDATCSRPGDVDLDVHPVTFTGMAPFQVIPEASGILDGAARSVNCALLLTSPSNSTNTASQVYFDDLYFQSTPPAASTVKLGGYLSGNWYDPTHSGQGLQLEFTDQQNTLLAIWFTYAPDGSGQRWIFGQGDYDPNTNEVTVYAQLLSGAKFPPLFDVADVQRQLWGKLTFVFTDCNHAQLVWNGFLPGYGSGSMPLTRLTSIRGTSCTH